MIFSVNYKFCLFWLPFLSIILLSWHNLNSKSLMCVCILYNNYFRGIYQESSFVKSFTVIVLSLVFSRFNSTLLPIYFSLCNLYDRVFPSLSSVTNEYLREFIFVFDNKYFWTCFDFNSLCFLTPIWFSENCMKSSWMMIFFKMSLINLCAISLRVIYECQRSRII